MCKFFSFVVVRGSEQQPEQYLWRWWTDSHSEILTCCNLDDSKLDRMDKAKCEFSPPHPDDILHPEKWTFHVDEDVRPKWFDADAESRARKWAEGVVKSRTITTGKRRGIYEGWWIVAGDAVVTLLGGGARIIQVRGSAQITDVRDSAQITGVGDSAQITGVGDSARITGVRGSAQITNVGGSAQITNVGGSARITDVGDSARITGVGDSAQITNVRDSARITNVWDSAKLDNSAKKAAARTVAAGKEMGK